MTQRLRRQAGFTLIELMISLIISSLLVVMLLTIFARVSFAYREQQLVSQLQQQLSAVQGAFNHDAKQAGLMLAQGFTIAADFNAGNNYLRPPIRVVNSSSGPDEVGFYYADLDKQAIVTSVTLPSKVAVSIDADPGFAVGERVVMSTGSAVSSIIDATGDAKVMQYSTCVLEIASVIGTEVTFSQTGTWGRAGNTHCQVDPIAGTVIAKFVGRYWRIDTTTPARAAMGALQLDPAGALTGVVDANFQDQAYGIVDLQVATYFYDGDALDTNDPDADGDRDWQSSEAQETYTNPILVPNTFLQPLVMSFSVVARTAANSEGVFTAATPQLTVTGNTDNNTVGDRATQALPHATDPALQGYRVYRYITFQVEPRNTGVGR